MAAAEAVDLKPHHDRGTQNETPAGPQTASMGCLAGAGIGIVLLNEAADSVHFHPVNLLVVVQIAIGLGCFVFAGLCAAKRI